MNETFILDKEFLFKSNIHEISSISIEHNYDVVGSNCEGEFILSGEYRSHEVSVNKEDFNFKIPFTTELRSNVNLDSVEVEINDFSYELNEDVLSVHIEYLIRGEQSLIEFAEEADLEDFLKNNEAEIIDFSEEKEDNEEFDKEDRIEEIFIPEIDEHNSNNEIFIPETNENNRKKEILPNIKDVDQIEIVKEDTKVTEADKNTIINSINSEESFITYHVHTVIPSDTIESICTHYNINLNDLKKYNNVDELVLNMKLIIPDEEN